MKAERLADVLWRWTGVHPQWEPGPDEQVPREVGCVYYAAEDAVVLIDPLVPTEAREHFLASLDLLSVPETGLRVAPDQWLPPEERGGRMSESLRFLLDLPVERVLVGHGEPYLANAREALERACGDFRPPPPPETAYVTRSGTPPGRSRFRSPCPDRR